MSSSSFSSDGLVILMKEGKENVDLARSGRVGNCDGLCRDRVTCGTLGFVSVFLVFGAFAYPFIVFVAHRGNVAVD